MLWENLENSGGNEIIPEHCSCCGSYFRIRHVNNNQNKLSRTNNGSMLNMFTNHADAMQHKLNR